jgi:uncharacterized protein (DUF4213/DUF364 family)
MNNITHDTIFKIQASICWKLFNPLKLETRCPLSNRPLYVAENVQVNEQPRERALGTRGCLVLVNLSTPNGIDKKSSIKTHTLKPSPSIAVIDLVGQFPLNLNQYKDCRMNIQKDLLNSLMIDAPVRLVLVGAHWTLVCSHHCAMAATLTNNFPHGYGVVHDVGRLQEKSARELAQYLLSANWLEASIGLAALNSLIDVDESQVTEVNAVDVLIDKGRGKKVALIGHFPFIPRLKPAASNLWVLEQNPAEDEYPAEAASELLPQAEVVAITSSTLINHTLEGLLELCRPDALVMMLGPSTPLSPVLFNHGVGILSGSKVVDEAALIRTVGQGATFQQVEGVCLLTLSRSTWSSS